ncbi:MAG: hypothetical protein R8J94_03865 [Acidimicrobiia bacterium]|nr:hypothetical protein [Acidimicrobiia bacterium]
MTQTERLMWTKIVVMVSLLATACSAETVTQADTPLVTRKIDDNSTTMTALAHGTLVLSGGCLALEQIDGALMTIVWRDGAAVWDEGLEQVTMSRFGGDDFEASVGDSIELGGGEASSSRGFDYAVRPADDCPDLLWVTG